MSDETSDQEINDLLEDKKDIPFQKVEEYLENILNNQSLSKVMSKDGTIFVVFSHPDARDVLKSRHIREIALAEAEEAGLPSVEDIDDLIENGGVIKPETEAEIRDVSAKMKAQEKLLSMTRLPGRRIPIEEALQRLSDRLDELHSEAAGLYYLTSEKKADEVAMLYMAWASTYTLDGERFWEDFQGFEEEVDLKLRASILQKFSYFNAGYKIKLVRYIARHSIWRIRYVAATKLGGRLFTRDYNDLTTDQLSLLYWSNHYQSIYEMMPNDQPDEDVIKDDEALDHYMEVYFKQREEEKNEGKVNRTGASSSAKKLSAWERGDELIITSNHPQAAVMQYSEQRIKAGEGTTDVEVVDPRSRRGRNRAKARLGR